MYVGLHVKYSLLFSGFNETWIVSKDTPKIHIVNHHENPSSGSRVVPCEQTEISPQTALFLLSL